MFGRTLNIKVPKLPTKEPKNRDVRKTDKENKQQMKQQFEQRHTVKPAKIDIGDSVLVKQEKKDKLTTPFNPTPLKVKDRKGTMITASDGQRNVTRNSSHFKKIAFDDNKIEEILDSETSEVIQPETQLRRSGRERTRPKYLNDYVCG